jgi:hypothetical protein
MFFKTKIVNEKAGGKKKKRKKEKREELGSGVPFWLSNKRAGDLKHI